MPHIQGLRRAPGEPHGHGDQSARLCAQDFEVAMAAILGIVFRV